MVKPKVLKFEDIVDFIKGFDSKTLKLYENYKGLSIKFDKNEYLLKGDDYENFLGIVNYILPHMNKIESLEIKSRFYNEIDYSFLIKKPKTLKKLYIDHLNGLSPKFANNLNYLEVSIIYSDDIIEKYENGEIYKNIKKILFLEGEDSLDELDDISIQDVFPNSKITFDD